MRRSLFTILLAMLLVEVAQASHMGIGSFGLYHSGFDHGGFGRHGFGGYYRGLGGFNTDRLQSRFEDKFDYLMSEYDSGLAELEDFYNTDEYTGVVEGMERLVDRYDLFVSGVERTVERLDDVVAIANDDLSYYTDLLADYEARDDLSEERLDRIVMRLTRVQDHLSMKIESLTEKQTTLSGNFDSYQMFSTELSDYLTEITAASGGMTDAGDSATEILAASSAIAALAATSASSTLFDEAAHIEAPQLAVVGMTAAEPGTGILIALAMSVVAASRPSRTREMSV